jgi:hypothetical protein
MGLCKNGIKEISVIKVAFTCQLTKKICEYAKWCFLENKFKMLYPYCEEECENFELEK